MIAWLAPVPLSGDAHYYPMLSPSGAPKPDRPAQPHHPTVAFVFRPGEKGKPRRRVARPLKAWLDVGGGSCFITHSKSEDGRRRNDETLSPPPRLGRAASSPTWWRHQRLGSKLSADGGMEVRLSLCVQTAHWRTSWFRHTPKLGIEFSYQPCLIWDLFISYKYL